MVREERTLEKNGTRSIGSGRRLRYLFITKVVKHNMSINKQFRHERMMYCHARAAIARLKMTQPTIKEAAKAGARTKNLLKFVNNIIAAHRLGAVG